MSVAFAVAPRHRPGTDCRCFAQLTFWSLKVIHMRGVNAFSISHRAAVNSWNNEEKPARAGSSPFKYPTTVAASGSAKHGKVMKIQVFPTSVGQLPSPCCYTPALALLGRGWGPRQQPHKDVLPFLRPQTGQWEHSCYQQQEIFVTVISRTKICSRDGKGDLLLDSKVPQKVSPRDIGLNRHCK